MKKLNVIIIATIVSATLFSCQKETVQPVNQPATTTVATTQDVQLTENNSTKLTWDQLPENLKNAEVITAENASTAKVAASYLTRVGPWGGSGGGAYSIYPTSSTDKIYAIAVRSGSLVDGLSVWYIRTNGSLYMYGVGGTGGAFYFQPFSSTERILAVAGRSGSYLDRLTIYTNQKSFSYGGNGGNPFYAGTAAGTQILGFYGGSGVYVDRIGAYIYSL